MKNNRETADLPKTGRGTVDGLLEEVLQGTSVDGRPFKKKADPTPVARLPTCLVLDMRTLRIGFDKHRSVSVLKAPLPSHGSYLICARVGNNLGVCTFGDSHREVEQVVSFTVTTFTAIENGAGYPAFVDTGLCVCFCQMMNLALPVQNATVFVWSTLPAFA